MKFRKVSNFGVKSKSKAVGLLLSRVFWWKLPRLNPGAGRRRQADTEARIYSRFCCKWCFTNERKRIYKWNSAWHNCKESGESSNSGHGHPTPSHRSLCCLCRADNLQALKSSHVFSHVFFHTCFVAGTLLRPFAGLWRLCQKLSRDLDLSKLNQERSSLWVGSSDNVESNTVYHNFTGLVGTLVL